MLIDFLWLAYGVALVQIYNAGLKCAARCSLEMQDPANPQKFAICSTLSALYLHK